MHIPRYWAKGIYRTTDKRNRPVEFACWGWSDDSREDAQRKGRERAEANGRRYLGGEKLGEYDYDVHPFREEVLRDLGDGSEKPRAVVTRNRYGCHVLNVERIMFVDVDLPEPGTVERLKHWVQRLFDKTTPSPGVRYEQAALAKLETLTSASRAIGVRVYRTRADLRYLFATDFADPTSDTVHETMRLLGADPLFMRLCKRQECFRARLTPKPWRCGVHDHTPDYPRSDDAAERRFREWEARYSEASRPFAVCRFVGTFGSASVHCEIAPLVAMHDEMTGIGSELPLA